MSELAKWLERHVEEGVAFQARAKATGMSLHVSSGHFVEQGVFNEDKREESSQVTKSLDYHLKYKKSGHLLNVCYCARHCAEC